MHNYYTISERAEKINQTVSLSVCSKEQLNPCYSLLWGSFEHEYRETERLQPDHDEHEFCAPH